MAPDSIRTAIGDTLSDLGKDNLENFCDKLVNRGGQPRVRRNRVEGKSYLGITDALVSTFTESGALDVTVELLKKIGCSQAAEDLVEDTKHLRSGSGASGGAAAGAAAGAPAGAPAGAAAGPASATNEHFIDKHRTALIKRVTCVSAILDDLLDARVISPEKYDEIRIISTRPDQMRELYAGPLKASVACKDKLYESLLENEKYLMADLMKN